MIGVQQSASDCVVVGGGVIGLSIAYRLAQDGQRVTLLERAQTGREASWAGAGLLPPGSWYSDHPALETMAELARPMHAELSRRLLDESGVDDEFTECGALYLESEANAHDLHAAFARWRKRGVTIDAAESRGDANAAWWVPAEAQVRNPRRLRALATACVNRGVRMVTDSPVERLRIDGDRVVAAETPAGAFSGGEFILAAGCWTPAIADTAGSRIGGKPIRGQMLLLGPGGVPIDRILHAEPYYIVPRRDGRVLVGATVEDVGFDCATTDAAREQLLAVARQTLPGGVADRPIEALWAGLRPGGAGPLPAIGRLPERRNLLVASGHFRTGLQFAPPTADLVCRHLRGEPIPPWAEAFDPAGRIVST